MHNLDNFLKHVTDDIVVSNPTESQPAETAPKATKKGPKSKVKTEPAVISSQDSTEAAPAPTAKSASAGKVNGGVNFILADIDTANSLVRLILALLD